MNDSITLNYELKNPISWDETVQAKIFLNDLTEYIQITKTLAAMISFFTKIGYMPELISEAFSDIATQLEHSIELEENPNLASSEEEIDTHLKKVDAYSIAPSLTLSEFKAELHKEAFIQYIYQIYLEDDKEIN